MGLYPFHDLLYQHLGCRCTARYSDRFDAVEPSGVEVVYVGDEVALDALLQPELHEAARVRGVLGAYHEEHVDLLAQFEYGGLAVACRVAQVARVGPDDSWEAGLERFDDLAGLGHGEGGLRDVGEFLALGDVHGRDVGLVLDERDGAFGELAYGAFHLGVARMPDKDDVAACVVVALRAVVHLEHQRAARVEDLQVALLGVGVDMFCYPVGGEYDDRAFGNLVNLVNEYDAFLPEGIDDELVVHDLMAHVDGGGEFFESLLDYVDGTVDSGAEPAGGGEYDFLHGCLAIGGGSSSRTNSTNCLYESSIFSRSWARNRSMFLVSVMFLRG